MDTATVETRVTADSNTAAAREWVSMDSLRETTTGGSEKPLAGRVDGSAATAAASNDLNVAPSGQDPAMGTPTQFKVYKRRWFGLVQLSLLNIIVSWDWLTFSAVSASSAQYFGVSQDAINWLSTGFLFAFVVISPVTLWTLNRGTKPAIITCAALVLVGNWIRYAGARANVFGVVLFAQILIGFGQPFVLAAPTRFSDLWFTDRGRITATAVASLANPLGGALGQLIGPMLATDAAQTPNLVLYVAIISSIASIPAFFIPAKPPTPPSASCLVPKAALGDTFRALGTNVHFWLVLIPFGIYVGFFNSISSLINQVLEPYGFSETQAGIGGALLIVVGLVAAAITSPIIDRTHQFLLAIRILVPLVAASYLILIWMPQTRSLAGSYVVLSVLGAASFSLMPVALEYVAEVTFPASPEVTSVICWSCGQLLGGVFIIIQAALKDNESQGPNRPAGNEYRALVFEAVICVAVAPLPLVLGVKRLGLGSDTRRRFLVDEGRGAAQPARSVEES